jgi:pimeloyl-ACP methyl ester carboxylesterase
MRNVIFALCAYLAASVVRAQSPRVVPVDGHQMRVWIAGTNHAGPGHPTVVLESGLGGRLEEWDRVFSKVAAFASVVAYDRAGVGQSESDGELPTPRHVARKLHGLLAQIDMKPPYVLVGHSWGGPLIRMFAALYPQDTAGLVYVDPTDMRSEEQQLEYYKARGYAAADVPALREKKRQQFRAYGPEMSVAMDFEDTYFAEFRALPPPPDVPVSVVMATKFDPAPWAGEPCKPRDCHDAWVRLRIGWLTPLARQSSDGTFTLTTKSGHRVPQEDPDLVVWAIQRVLTSAQAGR